MLPRRSVVGSSCSARESATFSAAIAAGRRVGVGDQAGEVVAALGERGDRLRGVDEEARQRALVLGDLAGQHARGRQHRVEVLGRLRWPRSPLPSYCVGEALDDVLQVAARLLVERVEELVEVDDRRRRVAVAASRRRRARAWSRARASARCSGWRCPTARSRGSSPGCPRAAARRAPRPSTPTAAWLSSVSSIVLIVADAAAADLDVVALDELAGVLEQQRVLVPAAAAGRAAGSPRARRRATSADSAIRVARRSSSHASSSGGHSQLLDPCYTVAHATRRRAACTLSVVC